MRMLCRGKGIEAPLLAILLAALVAAVLHGPGTAMAQSSGQSSGMQQGTAADSKQGEDSKQLQIDEYDRTAQVWFYQRIAKSGAERGQEIYYMKCWICHNDYTRKATPASAGPSLRNLYKRAALMNGDEVNDQNVMAQIRFGNARMPGYDPVLTSKDLADLVAYLREKCCWDEMNPPANPRYHPQ